MVKQFKEILFSKDIYRLENWIRENKVLIISELNSFISGLERDIESKRMLLHMEYCNGLAEGIINKIKVIKRIMIGHYSFELFRKKVLLIKIN